MKRASAFITKSRIAMTSIAFSYFVISTVSQSLRLGDSPPGTMFLMYKKRTLYIYDYLQNSPSSFLSDLSNEDIDVGDLSVDDLEFKVK